MYITGTTALYVLLLVLSSVCAAQWQPANLTFNPSLSTQLS